MLCTYVLFVSLFVTGVNGYADCVGNRKGDAWCASRIAIIKSNTAYVATNPSLSFTGNLCTAAAGDGGLFRWELCCQACKDFRTFPLHIHFTIYTNYPYIILVGGSSQAIKDVSYVNTASVEACIDSPAATTLCAVSS